MNQINFFFIDAYNRLIDLNTTYRRYKFFEFSCGFGSTYFSNLKSLLRFVLGIYFNAYNSKPIAFCISSVAKVMYTLHFSKYE